MIIINNNFYEKIDLKLLINRYEILLSLDEIIDIYNKENRFYHNFDHIIDLLKSIRFYDERLIIAILFHDIVYDIKSDNNEENSIEFLRENSRMDSREFREIKDIMIATKAGANAMSDLEREIKFVDNKILYSENIYELLDWEEKIFKEYQAYPLSRYLKGRSQFLENCFNLTNNRYLLDLKNLILNKEYKIGFYPGSFNPFHKGHYDILKQAEKLFDKVILGFGINHKKIDINRYEKPQIILNREIIEYSGLITTVLKEIGKDAKVSLVRGLRNEYDIHHEENLRYTIKDFLPNQDFIYLFCNKKYEHISSSLIRELDYHDSNSDIDILGKYCL